MIDEQKEALVRIIDWLRTVNHPCFTLGGFAGTGKTTLISQLRLILNKMNPKLSVAFCAYTGKASRVLAERIQLSKAVFKQDSISTIHSLIYAPIVNGSGMITGWKKKNEVEADLIIVDEASMLDRKIYSDLMSFKIPILAVGDHGQLPPIEQGFNLMQSPITKLENIHRQAVDNPIIRISMMAREEGKIPIKNFSNGVRKLSRFDSSTGQEVEEMLRGFNSDLLLLVGYNHSRVKLNQAVRYYQDFEGETPLVRDRVICLKNNWEKGIYNGMVGRIQKISRNDNKKYYDVEVAMDNEETVYAGKILVSQFNSLNSLASEITKKDDVDLFDFGYALTVHKAQGSQSKKVLLFEERNKHMSEDDWRRWLYTAVTRAEEELTIIGS